MNYVKRPRPYIPLSVRVEVAERQVGEFRSLPESSEYGWWLMYIVRRHSMRLKARLDELIRVLSIAYGETIQLDHDPALILRKYKVDRRKPPEAWFTPNANDPAYLIYRPAREHLQKTVGRKADAEKTVTSKGSDQWLKSKFNKLEGRTKRRPKAKIPARANPWPKGRKLRSRAKR